MQFFQVRVGILTVITASFMTLPAHACGNSKFCKSLEEGFGSKPTKPTECLITIVAPTYGGEVALDVRDKSGKSLWGKPRIKQAGQGIVEYHIGCSQVEEPTDQVYLCVDGRKGGDGMTYHSSRFRAEGTLDQSLKTHRLEMCLKGRGCPKWHAPADL